MAGRYSRNYSNYILRKKHQDISTGTIWERDWVTIGAQHQIERGKRPFFGDSGFLYTINNIPSTKKRHDYGKWVASWLYDDVKDATSIVNSVEVNNLSNDIRDFAYYGSCSELISGSILDIIKWYPGVLMTGDNPDFFYFNYAGTDVRSAGFKVENPFGIDLVHRDVSGTDINIHRFFAASYEDFNMVIGIHGDTEQDFFFDEITDYKVVQNDWKHKVLGVGITDEVYQRMSETNKRDYERIDHNCPEENLNINTLDVIITAINSQVERQTTTIQLKGYRFMDDMLFSFYSGELRSQGNMYAFTMPPRLKPMIGAMLPWTFSAFLKEEVVNSFFDNLDDFEKLLLRTDTNPLFKNTFLTPYETDTGLYYTYVNYVWPVSFTFNGLPIIDIASPVYYDFINKLSYLGEKLDELWCDNLWRNMTHESIKNYDWTYTRSYSEGDEEGNIEGGQRMEQWIRIYGRLFDDIKRYIDGIKLTNRVTYDFYNNMPYAELSDKLDVMGWDVVSTIPFFYDRDGELIDNTDATVGTSYQDFGDGNRWFNSINSDSITPPVNDNMFMRDLMLSSKHILRSKGTIKSIEMVMALFGFGGDDFNIYERYYYLSPKIYDEETARSIGELNNRENGAWDEDTYYNGIPVENTEMYNCRYIVPFFSDKKYYRGEFAFESRGGWGADNTSLPQAQFKETLSYLKVAGNIPELLSVNPYNVKENDIFYVIDLSGVVQYDEDADLSQMTHFFMCVNDVFTERYSSWKNIKETDPEYAQASYLYNIISTDVGNNPHVGYGKYDLGQEYREYMSQPFKYELDNYVLDDDERSELENLFYGLAISEDKSGLDAKMLDFLSNGVARNNYILNLLKLKKCLMEISDKRLIDITPDDLIECLEACDISNGSMKDQKYWYDILKSGEVVEVNQLRILVWTWIVDINGVLTKSIKYYLNSKYFVLENRIDNPLYKEYFMDVIAPYVMQVIPSTAILIFKDFN